MSQKTKKILGDVLDEPTPETEVMEEDLSGQHERRVQVPETATGIKRVTILFRGITKQLRNQLQNGVTRLEGQHSLRVSDQVCQVNIKENDLSGTMYHFKDVSTIIDLARLLHEIKGRDSKGKRQRDGQLSPISDLDKGLISRTSDRRFTYILSNADGRMYQSSALCLDVNTVGNNVVVRSDLKSAFWTVEDQCYPKTRQRFQDPQILSITSFNSGQHYWVVETSKSGNWRIGMCYPSIARKGFRSYIGCNDKSWGLCKWNNEYSVMHNCKEIPISPKLSCPRFAIFLDYNCGQLSFYELGNPVRLVHTFTATFTEPLRAAFRIWLDSLGSSWILIKD